MNVRVCRGGRSAVIEVPIASLWGFRITRRTGGRQNTFTYPRLAAFMSCASIPEDARDSFGHSCRHCPPPHEILVIVELEGRPKQHTAGRVSRLAWEANRLARAAREGLVTADAS